MAALVDAKKPQSITLYRTMVSLPLLIFHVIPHAVSIKAENFSHLMNDVSFLFSLDTYTTYQAERVMEPIISEDIKHHVEALMSEWHVPGLSIAVFDKKTVTPTSFGLASIEPKVEVTPDTIFDLASTSKSLTAAAVAKLATDNRHPDLTWNTPVSELLKDEFVLADSVSTTTVTVEDILSHRSGMPRHDLSYMGKSSQDPDDAKSITNNLRNLPLSASVRTKYQVRLPK